MIIPKHIAFIMDGNGRWAQQRGLSRSAGHKAGFECIPKALEACHDLGVLVVSGFAWSTENWNRPEAEIGYIMRSLTRHLPRFVEEIHARGVRFLHSGSRARLSPKALHVIDDAVELTRDNGPLVFNFVFNYGGRAELVHAARELVREGVPPEAISEETINDHLWTAGLPDVDLVIRTGGDHRISNFLLWQSTKAFIYVTDTYWPAMTRKDIEEGIEYFSQAMAKA